MDCSPPGSSVHGIFQGRVLEWVSIGFSPKTIYLGIKVSKEVRDLYTKIFTTLIKETEDTNKWKDILGSWIRMINIIKMSITSK